MSYRLDCELQTKRSKTRRDTDELRVMSYGCRVQYMRLGACGKSHLHWNALPCPNKTTKAPETKKEKVCSESSAAGVPGARSPRNRLRDRPHITPERAPVRSILRSGNTPPRLTGRQESKGKEKKI